MELDRRVFWYEEWLRLGEGLNVDMGAQPRCMNENVWNSMIEELMGRLYDSVKGEWLVRARNIGHAVCEF